MTFSLAKPALFLMASAMATAASAQSAEPLTGPQIVAATGVFENGAMDDEALSKIAGREDTLHIAQADQTANVAKNTVGNNVQTGDARIADNAFQNLSGMSVLNVNTGNNVAINAAMNVSISINSNP